MTKKITLLSVVMMTLLPLCAFASEDITPDSTTNINHQIRQFYKTTPVVTKKSAIYPKYSLGGYEWEPLNLREKQKKHTKYPFPMYKDGTLHRTDGYKSEPATPWTRRRPHSNND